MKLFYSVRDLFDPERTYVLSDFLNKDDTEVLLKQKWKLLTLEQMLSKKMIMYWGFFYGGQQFLKTRF